MKIISPEKYLGSSFEWLGRGNNYFHSSQLGQTPIMKKRLRREKQRGIYQHVCYLCAWKITQKKPEADFRVVSQTQAEIPWPSVIYPAETERNPSRSPQLELSSVDTLLFTKAQLFTTIPMYVVSQNNHLKIFLMPRRHIWGRNILAPYAHIFLEKIISFQFSKVLESTFPWMCVHLFSYVSTFYMILRIDSHLDTHVIFGKQ